MKNSNMIEISTGLEPNFLQDILTKDISTLDALYDLVDNSIDAARNSIIQNGNYEKDVMGLPKSYEGYKVHIGYLTGIYLHRRQLFWHAKRNIG